MEIKYASGKKAAVFKIITLLLLVCFTGCVSTKVDYVENDKVPVNKTYRISQLYLKDGRIIDVKDKEPKLKLKHKGVSNVIVYYEDVNIEQSVPLSDVKTLKIEIVESNHILTAVAIVGIVAAAFVLAFFIAIGSGGFTMH